MLRTVFWWSGGADAIARMLRCAHRGPFFINDHRVWPGFGSVLELLRETEDNPSAASGAVMTVGHVAVGGERL